MGEIPPGMGIDTTQELAPNATRDDVVVGRGVQQDELAAGHWHGGSTELWFEIQASGRGALVLLEKFPDLVRISSRDVGVRVHMLFWKKRNFAGAPMISKGKKNWV